jgi:hypothetical protein
VRREAISRILGGIGAALVIASALIATDPESNVAIRNPCDFAEGIFWIIAGCWLM